MESRTRRLANTMVTLALLYFPTTTSTTVFRANSTQVTHQGAKVTFQLEDGVPAQLMLQASERTAFALHLSSPGSFRTAARFVATHPRLWAALTINNTTLSLAGVGSYSLPDNLSLFGRKVRVSSSGVITWHLCHQPGLCALPSPNYTYPEVFSTARALGKDEHFGQFLMIALAAVLVLGFVVLVVQGLVFGCTKLNQPDKMCNTESGRDETRPNHHNQETSPRSTTPPASPPATTEDPLLFPDYSHPEDIPPPPYATLPTSARHFYTTNPAFEASPATPSPQTPCDTFPLRHQQPSPTHGNLAPSTSMTSFPYHAQDPATPAPAQEAIYMNLDQLDDAVREDQYSDFETDDD